MSAGVAAAAGKAQTICSSAATQPASWVWLKRMPAPLSDVVLLPWCIPTLALRWLGNARPASLLRILAQIMLEQQSSHQRMLSKESEPGALQINIFSPPRSAKATLSQEGCLKYACHSCARHRHSSWRYSGMLSPELLHENCLLYRVNSLHFSTGSIKGI